MCGFAGLVAEVVPPGEFQLGHQVAAIVENPCLAQTRSQLEGQIVLSIAADGQIGRAGPGLRVRLVTEVRVIQAGIGFHVKGLVAKQLADLRRNREGVCFEITLGLEGSKIQIAHFVHIMVAVADGQAEVVVMVEPGAVE